MCSKCFQHLQQRIHRRSVCRIVTRMDETQDAILIHNEVAAELGCIVAVGVVECAALKPAFDVNPDYAGMP